MNNKKHIFIGCYYTYFVAGAMSLMLGALLPSLMEKCNLNYAAGGILLSAHSIGFLLFSTLTGLLSEFVGRKRIVLMVSFLLPIALVGLAFTTNPVWLFIFLLITGFGRGTINNINNITVSTLANGEAGPVNILHSFFAAGGCISSMSVAFFLNIGMGFEGALFLFAGLSIISIIVYSKIDLDSFKSKSKKKADTSFFKNIDFYIIFGVMFFYLCSETAINGWLTTYLKDTNAMSANIAPLMVSLMWLVMIIGRLSIAKISKKIPIRQLLLTLCVGSCVVYGIFTFTHNPILIPILILGIGLFLSGIYPTCVSGLNIAVDFSAFGMGLAMGGAGLGAIIMPSITGFVSQNIGMSAGMLCIFISIILMLICAVSYFARKGK